MSEQPIDSKEITEAGLLAFQYLEDIRRNAPLSPPEREQVVERERSLIAALQGDPAYGCVAEMIVSEWKQLHDRKNSESEGNG